LEKAASAETQTPENLESVDGFSAEDCRSNQVESTAEMEGCSAAAEGKEKIGAAVNGVP
jgi:hypothetical protein